MTNEQLKYKWRYPSDWLNERIDRAVAEHDIVWLRSAIDNLMEHADEDTIQAKFAPEMDADGFFTPLKPGKTRKAP